MASCRGPSMVNAHVYAAPGLLPSNTTIFGIKVLSSVTAIRPATRCSTPRRTTIQAQSSSIRRVKTGIAIAQNLFVGPEAAYSGSWIYDQIRVEGTLQDSILWA